MAAWQAREQTRPPVTPMRDVSPEEAAALLSKPRPMLNERQRTIVEFLKRTPDLVTMRRLVLSFRSILRRGRVTSLKRWIKDAKAAGIAAISSFVRQLEKDQAAVENAVEHHWSNGPVEGHINRLKAERGRCTEERGSSYFDPVFCPWRPKQACTKPEEEPFNFVRYALVCT